MYSDVRLLRKEKTNMIVSELITVGNELGSKVKLRPNVTDEQLQKSQFELELVSIYEALSKKFSDEDAVEIITNAVSRFIEAHT